MPAEGYVSALREQIGYELAASQQYLACAVYYESETLPRLAAFFYRQALEERNHAMMMVKYLLDTDCEVAIPGVEAPRSDFTGIDEPVALALEQERRVSDQIAHLAQIAREEGDPQSERFTQWFLAEQVEEVALMSDLLTVVERAKDDPLKLEEYLAREQLGEEPEDPAAPEAAGGAL